MTKSLKRKGRLACVLGLHDGKGKGKPAVDQKGCEGRGRERKMCDWSGEVLDDQSLIVPDGRYTWAERALPVPTVVASGVERPPTRAERSTAVSASFDSSGRFSEICLRHCTYTSCHNVDENGI